MNDDGAEEAAAEGGSQALKGHHGLARDNDSCRSLVRGDLPQFGLGPKCTSAGDSIPTAVKYTFRTADRRGDICLKLCRVSRPRRAGWGASSEYRRQASSSATLG